MAMLKEIKAKTDVRGQKKSIQYIMSSSCSFSLSFFFFDNLYCVTAKGPAFYTDIQSFGLIS